MNKWHYHNHVSFVSSELLKKNKKTEEDLRELDEHKALSVLHRWGEMREFCEGACPLVPEHLEVRSLLNPEKPGLPQVRAHFLQQMQFKVLNNK